MFVYILAGITLSGAVIGVVILTAVVIVLTVIFIISYRKSQMYHDTVSLVFLTISSLLNDMFI